MSIDLFADIGKPPDKLHPQFVNLRGSPRFASARAQMRELQTDFADPDGNFVEQFQTVGFDSRTFELFMFAMLRESGHNIDRTNKRPDFMISRDGLTVAVEAVTASVPSNVGVQPYHAIPTQQTAEEREAYLRNDVPIRLGSPLFSKLQKKYWLEPHVAGRPFVLAIQDFHGPGSLMVSSTPLSGFLFGLRQTWHHDEHGNLVIQEHKVDHHTAWKTIPSGFFSQPETDNISAVLFCNSGTAPKFARMGQQGKHRSENVRMIRFGTCYDHNPDAAKPFGFAYEVGDTNFGLETWREGTELIRNPFAKVPLPEEWFGAAVEQDLIDGRPINTHREEFLPYWSQTQMFPGTTSNAAIKHALATVTAAMSKDYEMRL